MQPESEPVVDLAALTQERMAGLVGETFAMALPDRAEPVAMTLSDAKALGGARPGQRAPFSLVFRPADPKFYVPQQIYPFHHPQLGRLDIFVVPIRPDATGARFEAVFT